MISPAPALFLKGLDDIPPGCDVNVVHSVDTLPNITRDDVTDFEKTVARIQSVLMGSGIGGGGGGSHVGNTPADGLVKLQAVMSKMTAQIDTISIEFDRILSKAGKKKGGK